MSNSPGRVELLTLLSCFDVVIGFTRTVLEYNVGYSLTDVVFAYEVLAITLMTSGFYLRLYFELKVSACYGFVLVVRQYKH